MAEIQRPAIVFDPDERRGGTRIGGELISLTASPRTQRRAHEAAIDTQSDTADIAEDTNDRSEVDSQSSRRRRLAERASAGMVVAALFIAANGPKVVQEGLEHLFGSDETEQFDQYAPYTEEVPPATDPADN